MRPGQKGPTDLDLTPVIVIAGIARRPNHPAGLRIDHDQRTAGSQRIAKALPENIFLIASMRMLLPNQRIRRHRKKLIKILGSKGAQFDELAF
jgi:hypothetical protein